MMHYRTKFSGGWGTVNQQLTNRTDGKLYRREEGKALLS